MSYTLESYDQLSGTLYSLQCDMPDGITFLPDNLEESKTTDDFIFPDSTSELRKILRKSNCEFKDLIDGPQKYRVQRNADWVSPIIFIGQSILSREVAMSFAINLISSYVYDLFKGDVDNKIVKCEIVFQDGARKVKKIKFEGTAAQLSELPSIINKIK